MRRKLDQATIVERLKAIADPSLKTIEDALQGSKLVKCPNCQEKVKVKIPDAVAIRAAFDSLKLIPGIGTTTKVEKSRAPKGDTWQSLVEVLSEYSLPERIALAKKTLPEFSSQLDAIFSSVTSSGGGGQADAIN